MDDRCRSGVLERPRPLLFPMVGSLAGDTLRHDGQAYALPRHGFARRLDFALVAHDGATAHFRLCDQEQTRAVYPLPSCSTWPLPWKARPWR
jgi:galactose mutarotase-like enzyme